VQCAPYAAGERYDAHVILARFPKRRARAAQPVARHLVTTRAVSCHTRNRHQVDGNRRHLLSAALMTRPPRRGVRNNTAAPAAGRRSGVFCGGGSCSLDALLSHVQVARVCGRRCAVRSCLKGTHGCGLAGRMSATPATIWWEPEPRSAPGRRDSVATVRDSWSAERCGLPLSSANTGRARAVSS
jgi:hypothetical protein